MGNSLSVRWFGFGLLGVAASLLAFGCTSRADEPRTGRLSTTPPVVQGAAEFRSDASNGATGFSLTPDGFAATGRAHRGVVQAGRLTLTSTGAGARGAGPGFSVEAATVARGARSFAPWHSASGAQGTDVAGSDGPVRAVIRNVPGGIEQLWEIRTLPEEHGDLIVRAPVSGQEFRTATASGLHFSDRRTGIGTRYGHGTWVDASGRRTAITAKFEQGNIVLRVPEALVDGSTYPAVLDPLISPEFGIDTPVPGPPAQNTYDTAVARVGGTYLVVWSDSRSESHPEVYGTRIDAATGAILDPTGFVIAERSFHVENYYGQGAPAFDVIANGNEFLVVYNEMRDEVTGVNVYGRRVRTDGTLRDGTPSEAGIPIATAADSEVPFGAYFDGTNYLIAIRQTDPSATVTSLHAARLDGTTGALLSGAATSGGLTLMPLPLVNGKPAFGTDGTNVLIVYRDRFVRLAPNGTLLDAAPVPFTWEPGTKAPAQVGDSAVWFDGTNYVVYRWEGNSTIRASRITKAGVPMDLPDDFNLLPGGYEICRSTAFNQIQSFGVPRVVQMASGPVLLWDGGSSTAQLDELYGSRLDSTGHLLDGPTANFCGVPLGLATASPAGGLSIAAGTDGLLAVQGAMGRRFSDDLQPLGAAEQVTSSAAVQDHPVVSSNGQDFLVAWLEHRSRFTDADIYAARVAADGTVLDPVAIPISTAPGSPASLSVASNGKDYLVTWVSSGRVRGTRVAADGGALDGTPDGDRIQWVQSATNALEAAVGSDGVNYLVAWSSTGSFGGWQVYGARYDENGALIQSSGTDWVQIVSESLQGKTLRIAADRNPDPSLRTYLLTWERDAAQGQNYIHVIRGARVRAALGRLVGAVDIGSGADYAAAPTLAGDESGFLVAWRPLNQADYDVVGSRIASLDGATSATFDIGTSPFWADSPTLAYDGRHFWASWSEHQQPAVDFNLRTTRLDSSGTLLDGPAISGAFRVSSLDPLPGAAPDLASASNAGGAVLVAYTTFDTRSTVRQERVRARILRDTQQELEGGIVFQPTPVEAGTGGTSQDAGAFQTDGSTGVSGGGTGSGGTSGSGGASTTGGGPNGGGGVSVDSGTSTSSGGTPSSSGGRPGAGGSSAKDAGFVPTDAATGTDQPRAGSSNSGGCGCHVGTGSKAPTSWFVAGLAAALLVRARRRNRRSAIGVPARHCPSTPAPG